LFCLLRISLQSNISAQANSINIVLAIVGVARWCTGTERWRASRSAA